MNLYKITTLLISLAQLVIMGALTYLIYDLTRRQVKKPDLKLLDFRRCSPCSEFEDDDTHVLVGRIENSPNAGIANIQSLNDAGIGAHNSVILDDEIDHTDVELEVKNPSSICKELQPGEGIDFHIKVKNLELGNRIWLDLEEERLSQAKPHTFLDKI